MLIHIFIIYMNRFAKSICDNIAYYILSIPIRQFAMMEIERYEFSNGRVRAVYGPDSFIEVNLAENTYIHFVSFLFS